MWKLCPVITKQDHRYFNDNYYNCLVFAELQKMALFLFSLNAIGRVFLSNLVAIPDELILRQHSFVKELAQPPSSSSLSIAFGLAKSKENQLGNQRGSYRQKTEERGFRCGLCCHWTNREKAAKGRNRQFGCFWSEAPEMTSGPCCATAHRSPPWGTC